MLCQFHHCGTGIAPLGGRYFGRFFHSTRPSNFKVSVVGAAGGIGQPLSLLLKQNSLVTDLALYDVVSGVVGVGADLCKLQK